MPVKMKRAYRKSEKEDGIRVLVDRLWPRGVSREDAKIDYWMKEVAPSGELRKWFNHEPEKFEAFKKSYKEELASDDEKKKQLEKLKQIVIEHEKQVTLVYGAKDEKHNQATVLKEILDHLRID